MADPELNETADKRRDMKTFWMAYSDGAGIQEMMLDTTAEEVSPEELPEVLSLLPECKGKRILELAGGIGRFTGILAEQADHVTTVDFIENFIEKNKENNKKHGNIEYINDDAMNLSFQENSFDIVFCNWLLMYLPTEDIVVITKRILTWLKDGGYFFCRESCRLACGDYVLLAGNNPTYYRSPHDYNDMFMGTREEQANWDFKIIFSRSLQSYIKLKQNRNQICWLLQKCPRDYGNNDDPTKTLKSRLNSRMTISQLAKILGDNYTTILGCHFIEKQFEMLNLRRGQKILDVACGPGDFIIEERYSADIIGVSSSRHMIEFAWERKSKIDRDIKICFEIDDITERDFPPDFFDVVYNGREKMDVTNIQALLNNILIWLKPGGKLLFYEFCNDKCPQSTDDHGISADEYLNLLKSAGFIKLSTGDVSQYLIDRIVDVKTSVSQNKESLQKIFMDEELNVLDDDWTTFLKRLEDGERKWSWFYAEKKF